MIIIGILAAGQIAPQTRTIVLELSLESLAITAAKADSVPAARPSASAQREVRMIAPVEASEEAAPVKRNLIQDILAPTSQPVVNAAQDGAQAGAYAASIREQARAKYLSAQFALIRDKIMKRIAYPIVARKMGWTGRVVVSFTVREDGNAEDISIAESSGFPILDQNALEAVKASCPLPRPPVRTALMMPVLYTLK